MRRKFKYKNKIIAILLWVNFLFLVFSLSSCNIQKKAIKTKTDQTTSSEKKETESKSVFDFGTVDLKEYSINFEPLSHNNIMWLINKKGDTLKSQNAKLTVIKTESKTQSNKKENSSNQITTLDFERLVQLAKEREKTEKFDSSVMVYIVIAAVILGMFAIWMADRRIKKNTEAITRIIKKL